MAAKKKSAKKKTTKTKRRAVGKTRAKKTAKKARPVKKVAQKKPSIKKRGTKKSAAARSIAPKKQLQERKQTTPKAFLREERDVLSGREAGDLQGLSSAERADSESVDELLEEGNSFEAGVVKGVEDAGNADEKEVHTHEVPEDDVPEEYLDEDR